MVKTRIICVYDINWDCHIIRIDARGEGAHYFTRFHINSTLHPMVNFSSPPNRIQIYLSKCHDIKTEDEDATLYELSVTCGKFALWLGDDRKEIMRKIKECFKMQPQGYKELLTGSW